ncbi:cobalt transporter [Malaciobacter pacificus]|uniref:Cation diffusion facilitator family transporter n=2 Tax=Arcobacteraceae TaxID=2808963 RepID=A0A6L4WSL9_9BACT|nr:MULTISPECIES: cation diffusion facilitator family transporter [Arcobacteraceae]KAB7881183.1 cation diffusion facilitator family transporter [Poseidonibacter ostreae]KAB7888972.1 cation diffusion facilitator family transporter [Poseidonibacter ostreae]KAB7891905.1 cation diffusion facilitator family transporter [Poseidonibacter ostreae]QEP35566.1 cation transporter [Malaciobacter pacificus]GGD49746.1 cobalt transporter [Malaciobacter pacificus]|tara:strand:+ start:428 stop:1351 length:924 start_codon:yes stop_codon:yes gene_type:complete
MSKEKKILLIIIVNLLIVVSEIIFGYISNSFALIADALHNAGDVLAVIITYIALILGVKTTTFKKTFGYIKAEMMAAFVNTLFLFITMALMIYQSIDRFFNPEIIDPIYMIVVGIIAVIANGISAYILNNIGVSACASHDHTPHNHNGDEDANIKSAYLHMLSDALISVAVVVAGIFIYFFKIYYIDSILTMVFSVYILFHSYPLLKKSFLSLMDMNTSDISEHELEKIIKKDTRIVEYHDLHISNPSSKYSFISFHIVLDDDSITLQEIESITNKMKIDLKINGFNHILIQADSIMNIQNKTNCVI